MTVFNPDPTGKLLVELRDNDAVKAIVGTRVRAFEPAPQVVDPDTKRVLEKGDVRGPGEYVAFVLLVILDPFRERRLPIQRPRISVQCYAATAQAAMALYAACAEALHDVGPRVYANGLGAWNSWDDSGGRPDKDPDTGQPFVEFMVELVATTQAVVPA